MSKKIVILGCENSHANGFLDILKSDPIYTQVEVVGVYSDDDQAAKKLHDTYGVPVLASYDQAVGKVDGVIVTARHGKNHLKYAEPYIPSGVPMFIDKPITVTEEEALDLVKKAKENGVRLCGGSCLKFAQGVTQIGKIVKELPAEKKVLGGLMRAPISLKNEYGDFYFYSQHLVESVCVMFGFAPKAVTAHQCGENITVIFHYDAYDIVGLFTNGSYQYYAEVQLEDKTVSREVSLDHSMQDEFAEFYRLLIGGEQPVDSHDFIAPVFILNAINRSLQSGSTEKIHNY